MLHIHAPAIDTTGPTEAFAAVALPANPFNLLMEILRHPATEFGDDAYFIPKGTPAKVFPGKGSAKTLLQASKMKLKLEGVIELILQGDPGQEAVVRLRTSNVVLRTTRRGRPISSAAFTKTAPTSVPAIVRIDPQDHVRKSAARVTEYGRLMERILANYADIFESQFEPIRDVLSLRAERRRIDTGGTVPAPNVCHPGAR